MRKNNILMQMLRCLHTRYGELKTNEFGDEANQRLVESGMSAKLVATSVRLVMMTSVWLHDRSRFKPGASYQCGKARFVNVLTDW